MKVKAKFLKGLLGGVLAALSPAVFSSCDLVKDGLEECPPPIVELRFVYDYNMEFANAFHSQFDCLSAYIYDGDGRLVTVETVTNRGVLADENFRMHPDLPAGDYHVVAYGGMDCDDASFFFARNINLGSSRSDLHVQLYPDCLTDKSRMRLHNHFYGAADFTVEAEEDTYATVKMMRNTNSIQVALQHENGAPIDCNDFIFEITDDNNDFDCDNNLLPTGEITYKPWHTDNRSTGTVPDDATQEWHAALAQFTTSRLVIANPATKPTATMLHVRRVVDGETVFRVPLVNYMLMFKHDNTGAGLDDMGDQEYLDRENTWNFVFFLKDNIWLETHIIVNDWEVRLNAPEF